MPISAGRLSNIHLLPSLTGATGTVRSCNRATDLFLIKSLRCKSDAVAIGLRYVVARLPGGPVLPDCPVARVFPVARLPGYHGATVRSFNCNRAGAHPQHGGNVAAHEADAGSSRRRELSRPTLQGRADRLVRLPARFLARCAAIEGVLASGARLHRPADSAAVLTHALVLHDNRSSHTCAGSARRRVSKHGGH